MHAGTDLILTGATGFLGGHLMAALVARGKRVIVLGRARSGLSLDVRIARLLEWFGLAGLRGQVDTIEADLLEPALGLSRPQYAALCARRASIIHSAADTRFSERDRRDIAAANIDALGPVLDLASDSRAPFFHFVSTAYVAGRCSGICLEQLVLPSEFNNVYEETKASAEHHVASRCRANDIGFTILRPSIVYGDSRNGRSTRFNALYHPVRALWCLREIYADDIRYHGGQKAEACGIGYQNGSVLRLPVRICLAQRGQLDLIPVDYFVSATMAILQRAESGAIYHLTSHAPVSIDELATYCETFLGIDGIEVVEGVPGMPLTPPEALFRQYVEPYLPYLADARRFDRHHTMLATGGLVPPALTYEVFERCMKFAMNVDWGKAQA
jgi:nucleoside-diphosphate-sugar epimerase